MFVKLSWDKFQNYETGEQRHVVSLDVNNSLILFSDTVFYMANTFLNLAKLILSKIILIRNCCPSTIIEKMKSVIICFLYKHVIA